MAKTKDEGTIKVAKLKDDGLEARMVALQKVVDALLDIPAEDRQVCLDAAAQMIGTAPPQPKPPTFNGGAGPRPFGGPAR